MPTIKRDAWGVPHIFAANVRDLYWGFGYALAEDRLFQIDMARRAFTGRVAEVLGAAYLGHDQSVRANYEPASIQAQVDALVGDERDIFAGYAAGFNARMAEVLAAPATLLPREYGEFEFLPVPFSDTDVAMLWIGSLANRFSDTNNELVNLALRDELVEMHGAAKGRAVFDQLKWRNDPAAPVTIPLADRPAGDLPRSFPVTDPTPLSEEARGRVLREASLRMRGLLPDAMPTASNVWVLGPSRTTDGSTMLLNGPQFGWFNPSYVWACGLHLPGWDVVGNTPYGYPALLFGTNGTITWGSTAGPGKVVDMYQERLDPADRVRYLHEGAWKTMTKRTEVIAVRGAADVAIDVFATVHGHVVLFDEAQHTAYAKRRSWAGREVESLLGWVGLMQARDPQAFLAQCERIAISVNFYYADRGGNVGYALMGRYPVRPETQDVRLPAAGDGSMEWQGVRPFAWNPKILNPQQGYVANWNNKVSGDHDNTDTFIWGAGDRVSEITDIIDAGRKLDPHAVWDIVARTSFVDVNARLLIPLIRRAVPDHPGTTLLAAWDRRSAGGALALMREVLPRLVRDVFGRDLPAREVAAYAVTHTPLDPPPNMSPNLNPGVKALINVLSGPREGLPAVHDFLHGRTAAEVIAANLDAAWEALVAAHGEDPASWPAPLPFTRFRASDFMGVPTTTPGNIHDIAHHMNRGTENNFVRFHEGGVEIRDVTPPGQSGFLPPDGRQNPHATDQLALYASFMAKRQWLTPEEVAANAVSSRDYDAG